jgi:hypothetical protein
VATQLPIPMLLISLGIVGVGIILLGLQGYLRERYQATVVRRGLVSGWFLTFLGGVLLLVTVIAGIHTLSAPEAAPVARATATIRPTPTHRIFPTEGPTPTPTPTPVPTPALGPGWVVRERPSDGFAIAIPSTWVEVDLDAETLDEALAPIRACCPDMDLTAWAGQTTEELRDKGMKLFAVDPDSDPEAQYYTIVSVVRTTLGTGWNLDMALEAVLPGYEGDEVEVTHQRVTLPVGEAEAIQIAESGEHPLLTTKYLIVRDDVFWFITLGCEAAYAEGYAEVFETIPQTFRWMEGPTLTLTPAP